MMIAQPFSTMRERASKTVFSNCDAEELFTYSAQRWLWDEPAQLQRRYVRFNLDALVEIAEKAAGDDAVCVQVSKLPEGNFNKTFLAKMQDGKQLVVKIPNPNAGPGHYTTASEVASMEYVRKLGIPVPKVLGYCSRPSESKLGAEYIVMEKAPGVELGRRWDQLKARDKLSIVKQLAGITCTLAQSRFPCYGSLYKRRDVAPSESIPVDDEFAIGPTVGRAWFDDRRGEVDVPRGPWPSADSVIKALVQRETKCLETFPTFPRDRQQGIFSGPGGYHPSKEAKLSVLQDLIKVSPYLIPRGEALSAGMIWHNDLHTENIFIDNVDCRITSIIDWQGVPIYPMFLATHHPSLIDYEGPKPEGFVSPTLPDNLDTLDPEAKKAAKELFLCQSLWLSYEIEVQRAVPNLLHTFRHRDTLPGQILGITGSIYDDGEAYVQRLLTEVTKADVWKQIVGEDNIPCPLHYSKQDMAKQQSEYAKWERDVEYKARVLDALGVYTGWNGAVSPKDYDQMAQRLAVVKEQFLARESANDQERALWEEVWPFRS
ncbi:hypothetical protein ASPZODRAFT_105245 [Penicilliopsis zonata CBS 506.65]|uniref:Altered inheritance of mitochondria protein 9, mitochondrial n=1 Tax=Penicilliopsis zonata CBS 506.65 TaxID=1073090 RepID=A0A1L9S5T5_9EURO|nr:hypothetical protein ASPZODRAFT_105245 [Penicilliopsis zonata CBS 506.65]OJJ42503.1 hypothetical protein ASPZODRAFT_105245 [Penicilliopsis zonata CBS 506.65]